MPRRLLLPLLTGIALLLLSAPTTFAAPAATAPAARTADDPATGCADDELAVEEDDGTITCSGDDISADDGSADDASGDDGDDSALCADDWSDGEDDSSDEQDDSDDASMSTADDDACADDTDEVAPLLSALQAKVSGIGRRAHVNVSYVLDVPGEVALTLQRTEAGVSSGKRCVVSATKRAGKQAVQSKHGHRGGKRCTRTTVVRGSLVTDGDAGTNTLELRRWKGRPLAPGGYRLTAVPTADGGTSATTTFKLAAPR